MTNVDLKNKDKFKNTGKLGAVFSIHGYGHWPMGKYKLLFGASCEFTRPWVGSVWIGSLKE